VSEGKSGSSLGTAILGGLIGAVLTLVVLVGAARLGVTDRFVREAMSRNPEILVETADRLREKQFEPALRARRAALETPFGSSWEGSANPDVTLVEFYDYACGYCKASLPVLDRLVKEDPGLRIVYREFPILGPNSEAAARMSLAASKAGRFNQFHDALYEAGRPSPETLTKAAAAAGLPQAVPSSAEIDAELRRNFQIAGELGANGTPLFIVGNKVLNGAVGYEVLKQAIADARAAKG
jgi:thiol-disulfide isomerase/thioredoxin